MAISYIFVPNLMTLAHFFHKNPLHPIALDLILINTMQKFTQKKTLQMSGHIILKFYQLVFWLINYHNTFTISTYNKLILFFPKN
jgi:hypothetical protein